ncbi:MAG TPA: hypothetical protein VF139_10630 [Candidatus Polarisedimenticolaceae bacterium]
MAEGAWKTWLPWFVVVILVIIVVWKGGSDSGLADRVAEVEKCCNELKDCCEDGGPGRKPIIVLDPPSTGTLTAIWSVDGTTLTTAAQWGDSGELNEGAFGEIAMFGATDTAGGSEFVASSMTLVLTDDDAASHTLVVERTPTDHLSWTLDGNALLACDTTSGNGVPDCKAGSLGLPPELKGTITALTTVPPTPAPGSGVVTTVDRVRLQTR